MFKRLIAIFFYLVSYSITLPVFAQDMQLALASSIHNYQLKRLMQPSDRQIKHEEKERVIIYVGMKDIDIEKAMDEQFDRIEKFVFAATIVTDQNGKPLYKNGQIVTEDNDC